MEQYIHSPDSCSHFPSSHLSSQPPPPPPSSLLFSLHPTLLRTKKDGIWKKRLHSHHVYLPTCICQCFYLRHLCSLTEVYPQISHSLLNLSLYTGPPHTCHLGEKSRLHSPSAITILCSLYTNTSWKHCLVKMPPILPLTWTHSNQAFITPSFHQNSSRGHHEPLHRHILNFLVL